DTRHVGVAVRVHRDSRPGILVAAAEARGVDQCRTGGIELRYEGVGKAASDAVERGFESSKGCREVGGSGETRYIGVAVTIDCNASRPIETISSKVGRVREHQRIDDQGPARVVSGQLKADPI